MNKTGTKTPESDWGKFIRSVYASLDEALASGLNRLRDEARPQPSCLPGCAHCCRYHIVTSLAEARTLAHYIQQEWNAEQIEALRLRTRQWHAWDNSRPGRPGANPIETGIDLSRYEDCCPLLVDNRCSAYAVRPVVCRTHFVSTPPWSCQAANVPEATAAAPQTMAALAEEGEPYCRLIRQYLQKAGCDYDRTLTLLPHGLAIEMGWDFGIAL
jgi:Fe-S-cluster containining protein